MLLAMKFPGLGVDSKSIFLLISLACSAEVLSAAPSEPTVEAKDLPRVAPVEPAKAVGTFQIKPGFRIEPAATEPLVTDPVALSFDENGRLFVAEMRDYSERRDEALGRIRLLVDTDGDGRFDKSTVFAEHLPWPTAVICYGGGVFVASTPDIIFLKDTDGDGVADVREVVITGFASGVERINVQQLVNSFNWGLDNRIHGANGGNNGTIRSLKRPNDPPIVLRGRDFSFDPRTLELRAESGGGQYGFSFDDQGRKFVCSNSSQCARSCSTNVTPSETRFSALPRRWSISLSMVRPQRCIGSARMNRGACFALGGGSRAWSQDRWREAAELRAISPAPRESPFTEATLGPKTSPATPSSRMRQQSGSPEKIAPAESGLKAERPADEQKVEFLASRDSWFRPRANRQRHRTEPLRDRYVSRRSLSIPGPSLFHQKAAGFEQRQRSWPNLPGYAGRRSIPDRGRGWAKLPSKNWSNARASQRLASRYRCAVAL